MNIMPGNNIIRTEQDPSMVQKKINNLDKSQDDKKLMEACQEFESIFLYMMMKEMRKTVPEDGIVEKSQGTIMFEEMHLEEMANEISKGNNGMGLAKELYNQFKAQGRTKL